MKECVLQFTIYALPDLRKFLFAQKFLENASSVIRSVTVDIYNYIEYPAVFIHVHAAFICTNYSQNRIR